MILTRNRKDSFSKDAWLLCILPSLAVLTAMLAVTLWMWVSTRQNYIKERSSSLTINAKKLQDLLINRLSVYEDMLRSGAGLLESGQQVDQQKWQAFADKYDMAERYPGVQAFAYAAAIQKSERPQYEAMMAAVNRPNFTVFPNNENERLVPITFISPETSGNLSAVGFDTYSEPTRRSAIDESTTLNEAVISSTVPPRDGTVLTPTPSFVMYYPVRSPSCASTNSSLDQCPIMGYTFAAFRVNNLINALLIDDKFFENSFTLYSGTSRLPDTILYQSGDFHDNLPMQTSTLSLYTKTWTLAVQGNDKTIDPSLKNRHIYVLLTGVVISTLTSGAVFSILYSRSKSLRKIKDEEVQMVKDELLSLAAHQLRTPATAVKQYAMMALEGYGGDLNPEQTALVKKAFDNNERQLRTVNEMLYVANADAGNLRLRQKDINLVKLIKEAADEQHPNINSKQHSLRLNLPSTPLHYKADELYLRMAISNILGNASKYTPPQGKISISLKVSVKNILIHIKDNGVGIQKRQMPLLFKKFSRLDNSLSGQTIGSGLGLYLAHKIVELHNGTIKVASSKKGSTFTIVLPRLTKAYTNKIAKE